MYLSSAENLQQLSFADNYYVNDEDLHMLYDMETLHSLNFSGCPQVEDSGISVRWRAIEWNTRVRMHSHTLCHLVVGPPSVPCCPCREPNTAFKRNCDFAIIAVLHVHQ